MGGQVLGHQRCHIGRDASVDVDIGEFLELRGGHGVQFLLLFGQQRTFCVALRAHRHVFATRH